MNWWDAIGAFFGLNGSGLGYNFWSGIGSDFGELTLIGGAFAIYKAKTCQVDGCWRISKHKHMQDGTEYALCRKHHPDVPSTIHAGMFTTSREQKAHDDLRNS